jgi:16S rRNA (guanine527-N7)-methyltransferase
MDDAAEFTRLLRTHFSIRSLSEEQCAEMYRHYALLTRWNKALNLTTVVGLEESVVRHYCESLFLSIYLPEGSVSVMDLGAGAGFPGLPVAVMRPDCAVTLVEAHQRKAVFLREATRRMANVRVEARRADELDGEAFDWAISRAVKPGDVTRVARHNVGLLVGQDDAAELGRDRAFEWQAPVTLPWGKRRLLMLGRRVPRGTSAA